MAVLPSFGKVILDFGALAQLGPETAALGIRRPLLVTNQGLAALGLMDKALAALTQDQEGIALPDCPEHPVVEGVELVAKTYDENDCDALVAMGGGSMIDTCKAASIVLGNGGSITDYAGHPEKVVKRGPPVVAVPTTAGTGSEVSRGGGIHPKWGEREFGVSGGDLTLPALAICDPELTLTLPPALTAGTGMDALVHCMEGYLSPTVNPVVDAIALDGICRVVANLERVMADGNDREGRWNMMLAATQGGMAIAKGLGAAHTWSQVVSDAPLHHGAVVSVAMPAVLRVVEPAVPADKMEMLAHAMNVSAGSEVAGAIEALNERVGIPRDFRAMGYDKNDYDGMIAFAVPHRFNATSPKKLTEDDFRAMMAELLP